MIVYLNGRFVREEQAMISIHDRGFLYGDGLFESVRVYDGELFVWKDHAARFEHGCEVLGLNSPFTLSEIRRIIEETLRRNALRDALVRFTLSRGSGPRGYSAKGADTPTFVVTVFLPPELPESYRVVMSRVRLLAEDPISDFKNLNKLHQIVARSEADAAGANEALLTNEQGCVVEGTTTNLFWVDGKTVCTPPVCGILAGTTRAHVLRLCKRLGIPTEERDIRPKELKEVDGLFVTSCAAEVMEVSHLDAVELRRSKTVTKLKESYRQE